MDGLIVKSSIGDSNDKATNNNRITWSKRGNVVMVIFRNYSKADTNAETITGLPTPINGDFVKLVFDAKEGGGMLQYYQSAWTAKPYVANTGVYGSACYLTDE